MTFSEINRLFVMLIAGILFIIIPAKGQQIVINEFMALNAGVVADDYGEYDDWIELYNNDEIPVDINGYYITDNAAQKTKCRLNTLGHELIIQPGSYLILWADGDTLQGYNHLAFSLDSEGEQILIFTPDLKLVDSVTYGLQKANVSTGRNSSNPQLWSVYSVATPGSANITVPAEGVSEKPWFNENSGVKSFPFTLNMRTSDPTDAIYFTLDASSPDKTKWLYQQPLMINKTQVVRAAAYHQNKIRSDIASEIFLEKQHHLPVLALITDSSNLWGPQGIYSNYTNTGIAWERFAQFKYMENSRLVTSFNAGIRIQGASSIGMPKKSFRLFFRSEYGNAKLDFPLFGNENFSRFDNLVLKSGYDDDLTTSKGTLLRDALMNALWQRSGGLATQSAWAVLYINDKFWGIYNIRENINNDFIEDHTNYDDFDLIRFTYEGPELRYGNMDRWNEWFLFIKNNDLSDNNNYRYLENEMDMDYFANLIAFSHCTAYYSWGWGVSAFAENNPKGKWRFTTWDGDRAFTWADTNIFDNSTYEWADIIPYKLLQNPEFIRKFVNRTCDLLNTVFLPENSIPVLENLYNQIKPEISSETERWLADGTWEERVAYVRDFLLKRPEVLKMQLPQQFSLGSYHNLTLKIQGNGTIRINTIYTNEKEWHGGYFENNNIEIEAFPAKGYRFEGWNNESTNPLLNLNLSEDASYTAVFTPDTEAVNTVIISEIAYVVSQGSLPGEWIELYNSGVLPVDMSYWQLSDNNPSHLFTFPANTILYPGEYMVVAEIRNLFLQFYKEINYKLIGDFGLGAAGFRLGNEAETIFLLDAKGNIVDSVAYQNKYPWPVIQNAKRGSIQVINTDLSNDFPRNWWFLPEPYTTPGKENVKTYIYQPTQKNTDESFTLIAYPNPFNDKIYIDINTENDDFAELAVYTLSGKKVTSLYYGNLPYGKKSFIWNGTNNGGQKVPSGIYIIVARTKQCLLYQKIVLQ